MKTLIAATFSNIVAVALSAQAFGASLTANEYQAQMDKVLPPINAHGSSATRFSFLRALQDLQKRMAIRNPYNPNKGHEDYFYVSHPAMAADTTAEFLALADLFIQIKRDYIQLDTAGDLEKYDANELGWTRPGTIPLPTQYQLVLKLADAFSAADFVHWSFAKFLGNIFSQHKDPRHSYGFFFWRIVDPKYPEMLVPAHVLLHSSARASLLAERMIKNLRIEIETKASRLVQITREGMNNPVDFTPPVHLTIDPSHSDYQAAYLARWERTVEFALSKAVGDLRGLYRRLHYLEISTFKGQQFANDKIREGLAFTDLEKMAAQLGTQLRMTLEQSMLNTKDNVDDGPYHDPKPYGFMKQEIVLQHLLTMGSIMARVPDLDEAKGSASEILQQEIAFQWARVSQRSLSHSPAPRDLVVSQGGSRSLSPPLHRRDFAVANVVHKKKNIEDRLWKTFFAGAGLPLPDGSQNSAGADCEDRLLGHLPQALE